MSELKNENTTQPSDPNSTKIQENQLDTTDNLEQLESIKRILCNKFSSLSIQAAVSQDSVPFLHLWKPISKSSGVQGMPFLPCFHIIVTLSVVDNNEDVENQEERQGSIQVLFQLHSFHGKVLKEDIIDLECCNDNTEFNLVENMEKDNIQLCHGVEEIDCDKFKEFVKSCKLPLLSKVRSVFLIEQFMGSVVFRSRLCEFALENDSQSTHSEDIFVRCRECSSFQYSLKSDITLQGMNSQQTAKPDHNIFEKVYYKTSVLDMEALAVLHEVRKMYENPLKNVNPRKSRKNRRTTRLSHGGPNSTNSDIYIKSEPIEDMEQSFPSLDSTNEKIITSHADINEHEMYQIGDSPSDSLVIKRINDINSRKENNGSDDTSISNQNINNALIMNTDELSETFPLSIDNNTKGCFELQTDLKKKRGRPRKYHSRTDYLLSMEKRKERKKKEIPPAASSTANNEVFDETCQICLYKFKNESCHRKDQERHEQSLSDLTNPVLCPICNEHIATKYQLTSHFEQHHSEQGLTCCCECLELVPKGNNRLRQHILKTHHTAAVSLVCPDCGLKCAGNVQFQIHMAIKHSSEKSYMCQHCGIGFAHSKRLQVHLRRNHQPRDLQCPHCDKKFETRDQAIRHLVVHTGLKPYKCVQCQYSSYRQCNVMSVHFLKSHGRKGSQNDVLTDIAERDMMSEIAVAEVDEMLKNRKLKLKKEMKINNDSS